MACCDVAALARSPEVCEPPRWQLPDVPEPAPNHARSPVRLELHPLHRALVDELLQLTPGYANVPSHAHEPDPPLGDQSSRESRRRPAARSSRADRGALVEATAAQIKSTPASKCRATSRAIQLLSTSTFRRRYP